MTTIEKLKKCSISDLEPIITKLSEDVDDPELVIIYQKYKEFLIYNSPYKRELFYQWAELLAKKYDIDFLKEIRKIKIKKINDISDQS